MNQKNKTIFIIICLLITMIYVPVYITHASPLDENSDIENKNITNTYINNINIENQNINNQNEVDNKTIVNEAKNELINNTIEINNENIVQNKQEIELNNEITDTNQELLTNNITQVYYESESAADVETISTTEATIKAKIFDTNQYTDGVELTSAGITINDWQYSTSKYLQIDPVVPEDDNDYIISIELPKELYFVCDEIPLPTGYSKFEFTKNNPVKINSSTSYNLNAFSGKVEYYMSPTALSGTIQLEIRYDNVLWNKMANTILTPEDVKPIVVKLIKIDSNSEFSNISELRVNKIYSKDKMTLQSLLYYKTTSTSYIGSTNLTTTVDENVSIRVDLIRQSDSSPDMLLDVATFEIQLPYYTDSNNIKHYLNLSNDKIGTSAIKNTSYVIDNSEEGKIIITFTKPYFKLATLFTLNFEKFPEELLLNEQNSFVFSGGKVKLSSIAKDGVQELIYINQGINKITYEKEGIENININAQNGSVSNYQKPEEAVSELGILALSNVGSKDSVEKEAFIEFDINNTNAVKVTSMRLCTDSVSENIEIEYSMVDENGNDIYFDDVGNVVESSNQNSQKTWKCTLKNSTNGVLVYRKVLLESHQQFYFKTLKYRIKTILAGQRLYKTDGMRGVYSGGTIFGFSDVIDNATESIQHKITVTSPNNLEIPAITKTIATVYQSTATPSYYLNTVKFNKTNIIGGDNFIVTGAIQVYPYPYGTTMWLKAPIMGLVLPNGISVNTSAISAKYSNGTSITNITATSKDIDNGNRLWIIKFPQECCIGYYSETLSTLSNGYKIDFSVQLDTSYTINNTAFFANNIYLAGLNQINGSGGAMEWTKKTDIYDLNENGSTTDKIAGLKTSDTTNCQIIAQSATLDLDNNIILNTSGNIGQETTDISTLTKDDTIIYNLDINCNNGGRAEEFLGFIPIPKLNSGRDDYLITSSVENSFELALQDFATITGSDKYNIQYSFETNLTYLKAKEVTTWYTKEEIENNSNLNFKDITMLKLTVKDGTLENGDSTRITLNMKYNGTDYINEVGAKNSWKSVFFYNYINNDRTASGTYTTPEVKATITHTEELSEITLTAAKDMAPINPYNITEKDINYRSLKNIHNLSITNVEVYNVSLKIKDYILANPNMPGIESNESFAITIKMNNGTEKSITEDVLTTPLSIGTLNSNEELNYKLKIYNADSLTDNSLARYIIITLKSDNGITFKQKVNINRELSQATDPQSAIVEGKRYINFDDTTSEISLSQDSALTAQFVLNYIPSIYNNQKLEFSNKLPINTQLTLVNLTENSNVQYWYCKIKETKDIINLNEFIEMGKTTNSYYTYKTGSDFITEKLLVIIDFSKCSEYLETETNLKFVMTGTSIDEFNSKELKFTTSSKRSFELSLASQEVNLGNDLQINYNLSTVNSSESKYIGRKLALVIKMPNDIPIDSYITFNNIKYFLNSNKEFIIPLNEVQSGSNQVIINLNSDIDINESEIYETKVELWVSATSNALAPLFGEKVAETTLNFINQGKSNPSLKIIGLENRAIKKLDKNLVNELIFECKNIENTVVEIELQQKIGNAYQKLTNILNQVNNITEHNMGLFLITAREGQNYLNISLSSEIQPATYRFVIKVKDKNNKKLLEVPYNFIVLD